MLLLLCVHVPAADAPVARPTAVTGKDTTGDVIITTDMGINVTPVGPTSPVADNARRFITIIPTKTLSFPTATIDTLYQQRSARIPARPAAVLVLWTSILARFHDGSVDT